MTLIGIVMPIRFWWRDDLPAESARCLISYALGECRTWGYVMFLAWLDLESAEQREFKEICVRRGAIAMALNGEIIGGRLDILEEM